MPPNPDDQQTVFCSPSERQDQQGYKGKQGSKGQQRVKGGQQKEVGASAGPQFEVNQVSGENQGS
jgi:hypothetical protein